MIELFPGNIRIELDIATEKVNGITIISKTKRKENKGKVVQVHKSSDFKKGDHAFFLAEQGIKMDGQCIIPEEYKKLIFKKGKMELKKTLILIEADKSSGLTEGGLIVPDNAIMIQSTGIVREISKKVIECKVGDKVFFDLKKAMSVSMYDFPGYKDKPIFLIEEVDILAVL
jgi:co-chaperonin GroES (HSP10)